MEYITKKYGNNNVSTNCSIQVMALYLILGGME